MGKRILVTGGTGFIGSHLVQELVKRKYDVHCVVAPQIVGMHGITSEMLKGAEKARCDITDYHAIRGLIKRVDPDFVAHLAALTPVRDSFENPFSFVNTNVVGTLNIAYALMEFEDFKKRKLVYASTAEVYGIQKISPVKEYAALNPSSPYADTKVMTDMQLRMMAYVYGLNATVMRCTNSYGRKTDPSFFVEYAVTTMLAGEKVYLGAPESKRDYMYVSDHVNAYIKAIETEHPSGEAFNACTNISLTNKDVAYKIADMVGFDKKNIVLGKYPPDYPLRPIQSDQPFIELDCSKIKKTLGWKPEVALDEGLKRTIAFWKKETQ